MSGGLPARARRRRSLRTALTGILLTGGVLAGCGGAPTRDVRVTILDESGSPLPGAVFYAEAYDETGAFAFLTARAGDAGEVPDSAREPLKIPWRAGAHIALAAFDAGRAPAILRDPGRRIDSDGAVLVLGDPGSTAGLASLAYPFENEPALAARVARPEFEELREAFRSAWADRNGPELTPVEKRKKRAIDSLE